MTSPVPNMQAAVVSVKDKNSKELGRGFLLPPWNSFFQQLTQAAPAVADVSGGSPYTANVKGNLILTGATAITLTRGGINISLTGQRIIPISIGDMVTWTGSATAQFLGA